MMSTTIQFQSQSTLPDRVSLPDIAEILYVFAGNIGRAFPARPPQMSRSYGPIRQDEYLDHLLCKAFERCENSTHHLHLTTQCSNPFFALVKSINSQFLLVRSPWNWLFPTSLGSCHQGTASSTAGTKPTRGLLTRRHRTLKIYGDLR